MSSIKRKKSIRRRLCWWRIECLRNNELSLSSSCNDKFDQNEIEDDGNIIIRVNIRN